MVIIKFSKEIFVCFVKMQMEFFNSGKRLSEREMCALFSCLLLLWVVKT